MAKKKIIFNIRQQKTFFIARDVSSKTNWWYNKEPQLANGGFLPSDDSNAGEWGFISPDVVKFFVGRELELGEKACIDMTAKITSRIVM